MLRIALFLITNFAVMILVSIVMNIAVHVFGISGVFGANGINYMSLMLMCFCYGTIGSIISLFSSKWSAKRSMDVQLIENPANSTEQWLYDTVKKQADMVNIHMPEVGIFNSQQPNAFATGWNKNKALIAVSTGLLQTMNTKEVEAVLAHEIGHVVNGDMITLALIQGIVNSFVMFFARIIGYLVDRVILKNRSNGRGIGYFVTSMAMDMVLGMLASTIVMWFSRKREYKADEMGAKLAGKENMIAALLALKPASERPDTTPKNMKVFAISSGQSTSFSFAHLLRTHPTLDHRIEALQALAY